MTTRNHLWIASAILLGTLARGAAAQAGSLVLTQPQPLPAFTPTFATNLPDSGRGPKTFFTRHDLVPVGIAAAVTGGLMVFDERIAPARGQIVLGAGLPLAAGLFRPDWSLGKIELARSKTAQPD